MSARSKLVSLLVRVMVAVVVGAAAAAIAPAAIAQTGTVRAIVLDINRQPIQGAEVRLYSLCTQQFIPQSQSSGADGTVSITGVPVGAYHIGAYAGIAYNQWIFSPNFQGWQVTDGGTTDQIEIVLEPTNASTGGVFGFVRYDDATGAHPIGAGVHIDVYDGGHLFASTDSNGNGQYQINGLYAKLNNWGFYTYIATWTDPNNVIHYAHGVNFGVWRGVPIRMDIPFNLRPVATQLAAYATGDGKITLYWQQAPGARGYNVYRGTNACSENYSNPVNGGTLVTTTSYAGSSIYMFTDTGLTNGTEYFYTVKAVFDSESEASNEDSDLPDAAAVPWDTRNPGAILSAFRSAFASDEDFIESLRVVGPDNTIYDDAFGTAQPPDGTITAGTNQLQLSDGTIVPMQLDAAQVSQQQVGRIWPELGPYRRVMTTGGFRGVRGDVWITRPSLTAGRHEGAYVYLGSHLEPQLGIHEVDAGFSFGDGSAGWTVFLRINGHYVLGSPNRTGGPVYINYPNDAFRFASDQSVNLRYYAWGAYSPLAPHARLCLLVADASLLSGQYRALGAASPIPRGQHGNVRMKRVHSIAQPGDPNNPVVTRTGSIFGGVQWDNGQLVTTAGNIFTWNLPRTEIGSDGKFEGLTNDATITYTTIFGLEYQIEHDISIFIHVP